MTIVCPVCVFVVVVSCCNIVCVCVLVGLLVLCFDDYRISLVHIHWESSSNELSTLP